MMNSENKFLISISFNQRIEGMHLTIVDATFETIYNGDSEHLNLELFQGIYQLKANFIDYYQEYLLLVDSDKNFTFDFNYPSVAPILSFITTHEYFSGNSEYYSHKSTIEGVTDKPNFLVFGAKYDKDLFKEVLPENCLTEYYILDMNNELLFQLNSQNSKFDNDFGWFAFSNKFENGLYFLKWTNNASNRIFPFYIYNDYQTQFFIRYSQNPDFDNSFFFYSSRMEFRQDAEEYLVLDKVLYAYKDYKNYELLTEKDRSIIQQHPYLVTLVLILQLTLKIKEPDYLNDEKLLLPDLNLVTQSKDDLNTDDLLPVISSIMSMYAVRQKNDTLTFKLASLIDRTIDHLNFDIFWNNFSKVDDTAELNDIYTQFLQKSKPYSININDNQIIKLSKVVANMFGKAGKETIRERLNSLMGNLQSEDFEAKINDAIDSIGDISQIANKLNLPPTKVLRNYKTYKDIYNKLK
ncbi:MAG TPA: hypothetical protein DCR40_16320 [Prolixibacteraceae bacterium]|nr:hypothetical protein [Prolixibacteraceae bacterium]